MSDFVQHDGVMYKKLSRGVEPGDKLFVALIDAIDTTEGKVYEIIGVETDGEPRFIDDAGDRYSLAHGNYAILEKASGADLVSSIEEKIAALQAELVEAKKNQEFEAKLTRSEIELLNKLLGQTNQYSNPGSRDLFRKMSTLLA